VEPVSPVVVAVVRGLPPIHNWTQSVAVAVPVVLAKAGAASAVAVLRWPVAWNTVVAEVQVWKSSVFEEVAEGEAGEPVQLPDNREDWPVVVGEGLVPGRMELGLVVVVLDNFVEVVHSLAAAAALDNRLEIVVVAAPDTMAPEAVEAASAVEIRR
jgi:hypothetical protein